MRPVFFIGSEIYRGSSYGLKHPLAIPRVSTVMDLCRALGWLPADQYQTSPRARPKALQRFHTARYVAAVINAERDQTVTDATRERHGLGTLSNPVFPEMFRRPATAAGGSLLAAELVANGGIVFNPGGGTHHGLADKANGFCYFNDPVLCLLRLLDSGLERVAYVDIDAHYCDGVALALQHDPRVRIISVHEENRWPFSGGIEETGVGNLFNLPVPRGLNDSEFDQILTRFIAPAIRHHRPQALVLQCGADALSEDPLSRLELSNTAHCNTVRTVMTMTDRLIVLGGGGYNPWSVARAWTCVWAVLNGHRIPDTPPADVTALLGDLRWTRQKHSTPSAALTRTLLDQPRPGPVRDVIHHRIDALSRRF